jgi:hypothetical protein
VKFFLEILVLPIRFILLRQALLHFFPPAQVNVQLSAASRRAFKRYRLRYALLYTTLGLIFTVERNSPLTSKSKKNSHEL